MVKVMYIMLLLYVHSMYMISIYSMFLQQVCVCVLWVNSAKVNFQKFVLVRQFFHNIEQFSHDMYDIYH